MADFPKERLIPARYVGSHSVYVPPREPGRPYVHADGTPLTLEERVVNITPDLKVKRAQVYTLHPGDTLMMPEGEILGQTYLVDPTHQQPPIWRGYGWRPEPKHRGYLFHQLQDMRFRGPDGIIRTYEFHEGRHDFEPVDPSSELSYYRYPTDEQRAGTAQADTAVRAAAELIDRNIENSAASPEVSPEAAQDSAQETPPSTSSKRRSASTPESDAPEA